MASLTSFSLLPKASASAFFSTASSPPPAVASPPESLDQKFGRKGIKFSDSAVVLTVRNGSSLKLQIPNGHITSYKPKVYWKDDGFEEVLHTVSGYKGGVGVVVNELTQSATAGAFEWTVKDVDSDSIDALQVELGWTRGSVDITYVVSLYPLGMATAVIIKNNGRKLVSSNSRILSHFKIEKRSGAGVLQGSRGSSYCMNPPPSSSFEILAPSEAVKAEEPGFFSFGWELENKPRDWAAQDFQS